MSRGPSLIGAAALAAALPHRYPMLLVDRVETLVPGERIVAIKGVTLNEAFFAGLLPGNPVMPGVLVVEALAQAAGILAMETFGLSGSRRLVYFTAIDRATFTRPVLPGALLVLDVVLRQRRANMAKFGGLARVDGFAMAEAQFTAMIGPAPA
ncbi:3-hydroxyacyl-ACP dehydratase FabZ [Novosphingobium sp. SG720]|uniref:3-hydroxyacyl-ACP dehydratase FabZ n=1 Tax=Novosphingobium sp. SG720 TaxID=2586998 RepID=UPI0014487AD0|nr:3-hydroxyacyl-ACP dehydratase FabZ [Novosphingobium sp. SG720]